jgi:hypothetical protein
MVYTPGSELSYILGGVQHAMVVSENKVICLSGLFLGQFMLLVDWLIIAAGTEQQSNTLDEAHEIWTHAKEKAGAAPSLAHIEVTTLPQLLVPPPPCCDAEYACGCLELSAAPPAPPAAPELAAPPLAQSSASQLPELRFPPPLEALPQRHVGDKLKWELNNETYRIAVFTKKGVFEVKNVEDGGAAVHNKDCTCSPCSDYKMVPRAPWQPRLPLAKTFFADEAAWRTSLPQGGKLLTKYVKSPYVKSNYNDWI